MNRYIIGIDPSINSTGICVYNMDNEKNIYYLIVTKITKKMKRFNNKYIKYINCEREPITHLPYAEKEKVKTKHIYTIATEVEKIIRKYKPINVIMEGISYGSVGNTPDLAGINYYFRACCIMNNVPFEICSPMTIKKFATGNGGAQKEEIMDSWMRLDSNISGISKIIKVDDLADAYFMAHYEN